MQYTLGTNVQVGNKILTQDGWEKITEKLEDKIITNKGKEVLFGETIYGWKIQ